MKKNDFFDFLKKNRYFSLLWLSQIFSVTTTNVINFIMATTIFEKTGSTLAVSFLWIFHFLPSFFLGPFAGFFVDIWDRRKILLSSNLLQSLIVLFFFLVKDRVYPIYSVIFLYSLMDEFYVPAEASLIPSFVSQKDLPLANSLFLITCQRAMIVGLGAGGILMRLLGKTTPLIVCSLFLLAASVASYFLPPNKEKIRKVDSFAKFFREIKTGYGFIVSHRIVLFPIILLVFFNLFTTTMGISIPVFAKNILGIEIHDAGPLLIVPLGLGALLGIRLITKISQRMRKKNLIKRGLFVCLLIFFFFSLVLPYLPVQRALLSSFLMLILGIGGFFILIPSQTLLQENVPSFLRGRVFGTLGFFNTLVAFPFVLFSATMVDALGVGPFIFFAGLVMLLALVFLDKVEAVIVREGNGA